jgi:hypothetical protein
VRLTRDSTLPEVALAVGSSLRRRGVRAVLTGGACVSIYTNGTYVSRDVDYVIQNVVTQHQIDGALSELGFWREGDRYVHEEVSFFVEFPPGPLAVGGDFDIRPVEMTAPDGPILALSATDICKDRLAAFYHWDDYQSLTQAVAVACHQQLDLASLRRWSRDEGKEDAFNEFVKQVGTRS